MKRIRHHRPLIVVAACSLVTLLAAQPPTATTSSAAAPARGGRGPGVEASVVTAARSPEVNANGTITFRLQAPNAKTVRVVTDFPKLGDVPVNGSAGFDMTKDDGGVWSYTSPKLSPSYYQYWFVVDGFSTPDPQNTFVRPASGVYKSVVALPGKEAEWMMFRDVPHGNLTEHHYLNPENKTARRVVIYTPPGYNTSGRRYPVIYLLHGANDYERGWTQTGMANTIMDNLIADGKALPAIIVMPFGHDTTGSTGKLPEVRALQASLGYTPPPGRGPGGPFGQGGAAGAPGAGGRGAAPTGPSYMEKDLLGYVIPYVEKEFRAVKNKNQRALMGYSMGGGHSTTIGFGHPEIFANVAGFSGYANTTSPTIAKLLADPAQTNLSYKHIFFGSGTEDNAVNGGRALHATFTEKGIKHLWSEDPGYGHDYQIWRIYFRDLAARLFRE
jgi:enterochelin esterase family protein